MIHVVVLESDPPAVLVRFLTRRFIGEYASNASKCFQIVVGDYGGSAAGILVPESSFFTFRLLPVQPERGRRTC